jgi:tetratricopeptide (TPR) repeat protein
LESGNMSAEAQASGSVDAAIQHAARLLPSDPDRAAEQAQEILNVAPEHPAALLLLGVARRQGAHLGAALQVLAALAAAHPQWALAHYELALTLGRANQHDEAIAALRRAVALRPQMAEAWQALGDELIVGGDTAGAEGAYGQGIRAATQDPELLTAAAALCENRIPEAEAQLRQILRRRPRDVAAMRMLAEVAARLRRYRDAEALLLGCLELAPGFTGARHNYAIVLHRQNKSAAALQELDTLLAQDPRNPGYLNLKAAVLARIGDYADALEVYDEVLAAQPGHPKIWMSYGHALKTATRTPEAIAAYRRSIALQPSLGEAYWSLANLKTFRFMSAEIAAMRAQLARPELSDEERYHLHFAMGKALEDGAQYAESFEHYSRGNALRRGEIRYDADEMTQSVRRAKALCTREFFAARARYGAPQADPIFIVGLPRAGSTLLEQILSSHSLVEGTMELPEISAVTRSLRDRIEAAGGGKFEYPEALAHMAASDSRELGELYLARTRIVRKSGAPYFIDKMPNNFLHIGLIQLILPNAKIIDARRHPLGCCFSGFKQHFARGQNFSYRLEDIGRYYHDYAELMAHFDAVLPGRVHRVIYERMVAETETEVRALLEHCGLPFEDQCLKFYENERPVATPSAEQVRQPIYRDAVDQWRHYEAWLGPLKSALGAALTDYPEAPAF